jgi:hypothetical protein
MHEYADMYDDSNIKHMHMYFIYIKIIKLIKRAGY